MNTITEAEFKKYSPGAIFYCKDRRLLLYLGKNQLNYKVFLWVGCMMATEQYNGIDYIDKDLELGIIQKRIDFLYSSKKLDLCKISYKGLPNILECLCTLKGNKIIDNLISMYNSSKNVTSAKSKVALKRGYIYEKHNKNYSELYVYLGYQRVQIRSSYNVNREERKVHLFMFVSKSDLSDLQSTLKTRMRCGYDGSFGINFKKSDLTEIGLGLNEIPFSEDTLITL